MSNHLLEVGRNIDVFSSDFLHFNIESAEQSMKDFCLTYNQKTSLGMKSVIRIKKAPSTLLDNGI